MRHDSELEKAMNACRPGSNDLAFPEFAALAESVASDPAVRAQFENSQRFGAQLQFELHHVPVPAGLADRLLAALAEQAVQAKPAALVVAETAAIVAPAVTATVAPARVSRGFWSRRQAWAVLGAACVALVLLPLAYVSFSAPRFTHEEIVAQSGEWFSPAWDEGQWNNDLESAPAHAFPVESLGLRAPVSGWQQVPTPLDGQALLWELEVGEQGRAALAVMREARPIAGLGSIPPWTPQLNSGGRTQGAWQQNGYVFVLFVEGRPNLYRRLLPATPIATLRPSGLVKFAG